MKKDIQDIVNEYVGNTYYPASSDPPRKDFVPIPGQKGYSFPYQSSNDPVLQSPDKESPNSSKELLWPMQSISEDIADSYVYLLAATRKMQDCLRLNAAATKEQRNYLRSLIKICKILNKSILQVGKKIDKKFDLSNMVDVSSKI